MKIFVLLAKMKYEDIMCIGVFSSLHLARKVQVEYDVKVIYIEEYLINSEECIRTHDFYVDLNSGTDSDTDSDT
jgi:hypothetical protein